MIRCLVLVYKDENNRPSRHQISGIAYIPGAKRDKRFIVVPKDSQRAYIGAPEPIMSQCLQATPVAHPFDTSTVKPGDLEGYTIHSRCWTLIQKGLGKEGEVRLDVVIKTLRCRWKELFPYLLRYLPEVKNGDSDGLIGKNIEDDYKRLILRSDCAGVYPWPESDPIHIYELRTIIRKAYESRRSQRMIRNPRPVSLLSTKYGVPLEILCLIGGYLDTNELRNMTIALNEQFPVSFWRGQIPDIFFEIDNIRADRINWSFLAVLARSDFVQESDGVLNRRRLLDMIRPRKEDRDI